MSGTMVRVLVGATAQQTANAFVVAAQQFATAVDRLSTSAAALADQNTWNGVTAERFRVEQRELVTHLRLLRPTVERMADNALTVIRTIDNEDAVGLPRTATGSPATTLTTSAFFPTGGGPTGTVLSSSTVTPAEAGARIGNDLGQILFGIVLIIAGSAGEIGGGALDLTGIGLPAGAVANLVSAGVIMAGAGLVISGTHDLSQTIAAMSSTGGTGSNQGGGQPRQGKPKPKVKLTSSIGKDPLLRKAAEQAGKNQRVQQQLNAMQDQLMNGNKNPGMGDKLISGTDVYEARGTSGARIYFRNVGNNEIDIVGKSDKDNQQQVIDRLRQLYKTR